MKFDERGRELPDATPVALPLGAKRPESLTQQIRRMIRTEMSGQAAADGNETFEEANDFDVQEDDAELGVTQYELMADEVAPGAPRPRRPPVPEDEDDENEDDADGGSDHDASGLSSGPSVDDGDDVDAAPAGEETTRGSRREGKQVVGEVVGGSGRTVGAAARRSGGKPAPRPNPAKRRVNR